MRSLGVAPPGSIMDAWGTRGIVRMQTRLHITRSVCNPSTCLDYPTRVEVSIPSKERFVEVVSFYGLAAENIMKSDAEI